MNKYTCILFLLLAACIPRQQDHCGTVYNQASGMAALEYYYLDRDGNNFYPMHRVIRHPQNLRKNLLAENLDGIPAPAYNVVKMQSMLKSNRIRTCFTNVVCHDGIGLHALASKDQSGTSIMLWNYQWVDGKTKNLVGLNLENMQKNSRAGK